MARFGAYSLLGPVSVRVGVSVSVDVGVWLGDLYDIMCLT